MEISTVKVRMITALPSALSRSIGRDDLIQSEKDQQFFIYR